VFQSSNYKFKCPPVLGEYTIFWAYIKKDVRKFYIEKVQPFIKPHLLKYKVSYLEDLDPEDVENVKPHQKVNRQILFIIAMIVWVVETAYETIFPAEKSKQVKKKSAIGGSKKKTVENESEGKSGEKKGKRDKIE